MLDVKRTKYILLRIISQIWRPPALLSPDIKNFRIFHEKGSKISEVISK